MDKFNIKEHLPDDKDLVIFSVTVIALCTLFVLKLDAVSIIENVVVGLFGVAVGKATAK